MELEINARLAYRIIVFQLRALSMGVDQAELDAVMFQQDLALHGRQYQQGYNKHGHDKAFRNRLGKMFS